MTNPRSRERRNRNSQNEFRFTRKEGLQITSTRRQSRGPARAVVQFMNDPLPMYPFSGNEYPNGRQLQGTCTLQRYRRLESAISPTIFAKEGSTKCPMN
jgi:hypothetical protein